MQKLAFALLFCAPLFAAGKEAASLANKDIVEMAVKGVPDEVLISKINNSASMFDTSTDAIIGSLNRKCQQPSLELWLPRRHPWFKVKQLRPALCRFQIR